VKLVIHPPVEAERLEKIASAAPAAEIVNARDAAEAEREIADAEAFFGKISPAMLKAARRLRWVQSPTASLEHYLFPALVEHPLTLTNMRGLFSDVIADHVFGYILCFARNLHLYIRQQQRREWRPIGGESERAGFATGAGVVNGIDRAHLHMADQTLGVVGFGAIGEEVARRGLAFGMKALAVDPLRDRADEDVALWKLERLPELLAAARFVVICAPHTPRTEKMFRAPQFRMMRRDAYLVNIGRGAIVDLADLAEALSGGVIAGAALDVYETEPLPADHPLWAMENAILTPHVAGTSPRIAGRHLGVLLDNLRRFTRGEPLRNVVDKREWF
jgi:phosphoglycerate dehydrogenase-like enzyme